MRKVLALLLVLSLATIASATIIDVVSVDIGLSGGRTGTINDRLEPSDIIGLKIILTNNPYTGYPSYDGYALDGMDLDLHVIGNAALDVPHTLDKNDNIISDDLGYDARFGVWGQSGDSDGTVGGYVPMIVGNSIASMNGGVLSGVIASQNGTTTDLVWDLLLHCDGFGDVIVDLTLAGSTRVGDYTNPSSSIFYPVGSEYFATEADLGDLTVYQVIPEPITMALLGLGGLFLRRRK